MLAGREARLTATHILFKTNLTHTRRVYRKREAVRDVPRYPSGGRMLRTYELVYVLVLSHTPYFHMVE